MDRRHLLAGIAGLVASAAFAQTAQPQSSTRPAARPLWERLAVLRLSVRPSSDGCSRP